MAQKFSAPYESVYQSGLARRRQIEADKRRRATRGARRARVGSSGVGQLPQADITRESLRGEQDFAGQVGLAAETERLQDKQFKQKLQLWRMGETERERERERQRRAGKSGIKGQIIGATLGAAGAYLDRERGQ